MMTFKRSVWEIKEHFKETFGDEWETAFNNCFMENGQPLKYLDDEEDVYTDYNKFIVADEIKDVIEWRDALSYINEMGEIDELIKCYVLPELKSNIQHCISVYFSTEDIQNAYIDYVCQDVCEFLDWLWE